MPSEKEQIREVFLTLAFTVIGYVIGVIYVLLIIVLGILMFMTLGLLVLVYGVFPRKLHSFVVKILKPIFEYDDPKDVRSLLVASSIGTSITIALGVIGSAMWYSLSTGSPDPLVIIIPVLLGIAVALAKADTSAINNLSHAF